MRLYIPTIGRIDDQLTWELLPSDVRCSATLVCPPSEVSEHHRLGREAVACPVQGDIAKVRKWIIAHALEHGIHRIGVLDDDITGIVYTARHRELIPGLPWQEPISCPEWFDVWDWVHRTLDTHVTCGLADATTHPTDHDQVSPGRLMRNHFYNLDTLPYQELDWEGVAYAEDFHVTLQLIGMGHPNVVNNRYRVTSIGTQRPGGCAISRTMQNHNAAMRRLIDLHAPWVRQSSRKRTGDEDWIKVTIRWQAYWKHIRENMES